MNSASAQKCGGVQKKMSANSSDRQQRDIARHRRPADHRREGARRAADDDILRRAALEPHRIDEDVEEDRDRQDRGGEPVGARPIRITENEDKPTPKCSADWRSIRPAGSGRPAVRFIRRRCPPHTTG
jgi:hypothetical protein